MAHRWSPIADRALRLHRATHAQRPSVRHLLLLGALCLLLYLPGISTLPPVDRDEARFMQTTRQMVESGDYVRPRFQSEDRFRKPVGIYWLQALSIRATGDDPAHVWSYRLPSAIGALSAVLLTYCFGTLWYGHAVALSAAVLLASSLLLIVEAHLATTDAALLALIIAAQGCLGALHLSSRHRQQRAARYAVGFWVAQGLAILIKGPVAPLISGLTIVALAADQWQRRRSLNVAAALHWRWGVPLALLIVLPWAIVIAYQTEGAFFSQWWNGDVMPKLVGGHESHGAPPGTHLALLVATFWPGSIALLPTVAFVRRRRRPVERFLLAWLLPSWVVFELLPTKLPHYILPLLPPLALLCARAMLTARLRRSRWRTAIPAAVAATVIFAVASLGVVLPRLGMLWMSRSAAAAIAAHRVQPDSPLAAAGYHEPSLVFLLGGDIALMDGPSLASFMRQRPDALGLIAAAERSQFDAAAAALGIAPRLVWSGDGINYSKGRRIQLFLFANQTATEVAEVSDAAPAHHQALLAR